MRLRHYVSNPLWLLVLLSVLLLLPGCAASNSAPVGPLPKASTQDIRLTTDSPSYTTRVPLGVTLTNVAAVTYYALDGRSGCTLVQLQRYDTDHKRWAVVDSCIPSPQPQVLQIPPGAREPFTLAPGSSTDPRGWQPGLYRVAVAFSANADAVSGAILAFSAGFTIQE